jgi:hypothetical protein
MMAKTFKPSAVTDALILGMGAILESMPPKAQREATGLVRASIQAGLPCNDEAERILRGIFLIPNGSN